MPFHEDSLYEFNRFAPWELFSSAFRSGHEAQDDKSPTQRIHFNRGMLLLTFASMEAMANYFVQRLAATAGESKKTFIKDKTVGDKLDYIDEKTGAKINRAEFKKLRAEYAHLRNEIVHFKRIDQQEQFLVRHIQPLEFLGLLQLFFVRCFIAVEGELPYWVTGWNYTGFNGSWRDLYLHNNGNGFSHTLGRMGFPFKSPWCGAGSEGFAEAHMSSLEHFKELQRFLGGYPQDVEPLSPAFPDRPRLVRHWWDPAVVAAVEDEVLTAKGWKKPTQNA